MRGLLLVTLLVFLASSILPAQGKGMWGSRRKRGDGDDDNDLAGLAAGIQSDGGSVLASDRAAEAKATRMGQGSGSRRTGSAGSVGSAVDISANINMYLDLMENFIDGDEFDQYLSPEALQRFTSMIPAEIMQQGGEEILNAPELKNPVLLKQMIREGLVSVRAYSEQFAEIISSGPEGIHMFLQTLVPDLPAETSELIAAIFSGDKEKLTEFVDKLPGVEQAQKDLIKGMLSGDTSGVSDMLNKNLKDLIGDDENMEGTRKLFLENPEMAKAAGITEEQLNDPAQWKDLMSEGLANLQGAMNGEGEGEEGDGADQEELMRRLMESQAA